MADKIGKQMKTQLLCPVAVSLVHSADYKLKEFEGIVASSDSIIIDNQKKVLDLPHFILEKFYSFKVQELETLIF